MLNTYTNFVVNSSYGGLLEIAWFTDWFQWTVANYWGIFVQNIAGMHNDDITELLFPDDIQPGLKFVDDKDTIFLGYNWIL